MDATYGCITARGVSPKSKKKKRLNPIKSSTIVFRSSADKMTHSNLVVGNAGGCNNNPANVCYALRHQEGVTRQQYVLR